MQFDRYQLQQPAPMVRLPQASPSLIMCAKEIVEHGAALLALRDASLLSLALTPDELKGDLAVVLFDGSMSPRPIRDLPPTRGGTQLQEIKSAAAALFRELRPRWPPYAPPARLGVITDGAGLGFSAQDPWPLAPGWLILQVQGQSSLTELVPFQPHGRWRMMTWPASGRQH